MNFPLEYKRLDFWNLTSRTYFPSSISQIPSFYHPHIFITSSTSKNFQHMHITSSSPKFSPSTPITSSSPLQLPKPLQNINTKMFYTLPIDIGIGIGITFPLRSSSKTRRNNCNKWRLVPSRSQNQNRLSRHFKCLIPPTFTVRRC